MNKASSAFRLGLYGRDLHPEASLFPFVFTHVHFYFPYILLFANSSWRFCLFVVAVSVNGGDVSWGEHYAGSSGLPQYGGDKQKGNPTDVVCQI